MLRWVSGIRKVVVLYVAETRVRLVSLATLFSAVVQPSGWALKTRARVDRPPFALPKKRDCQQARGSPCRSDQRSGRGDRSASEPAARLGAAGLPAVGADLRQGAASLDTLLRTRTFLCRRTAEPRFLMSGSWNGRLCVAHGAV